MPPVIEMRTYKLLPGKREEFLEIFATRSVPAHREIGMTVIGPFRSIEDPDVFFFMRGFPDLAARQPMIEKYDVVLVEDTAGLLRGR